MNRIRQICIGLIGYLLTACHPGTEPLPCGPLPAQNQWQWHQLEMYAFVHFNMNTFTGREWGMGDESPALFNPTELDCRQWVNVFKEAGMKGVIITAKHHDGFCLWPTATTEHSVKNSPWKNGQGDVIRELSEACQEAGLKFGVYLSPWDRNNAHYGRPEYIGIFRTQLTELLTGYGDIFEIWFDGANGGSGYYGGANETRSVDRQTYYDWNTTFELAHKLQPDAVIFSDAGPDVRWVGNESGYAGRTNWSLLRRDEFWPGCPYYQQLTEGHEDGTHWLPAEVDVSIRPGWYYHKAQDQQVKSLSQLLDIYYHSVGRNASMLLNVPVNPQGLIAEPDIHALQAFRRTLQNEMTTDLARQARAEANTERGRRYNASLVNDGDPQTYWGAPDDSLRGILTFCFNTPVTINRFLLQEPIILGQRIQKFKIEARQGEKWENIAAETTIGYKRILRTPNFTTQEIRICIEQAKACPLISNVEMYLAPRLLTAPSIHRNKNGEISIRSDDPDTEIHYTTDHTLPTPASPIYTQPFIGENICIQAIATARTTGETSPVQSVTYDLAKTQWTTREHPTGAYAIDDDPASIHTFPAKQLPYDLTIDLGKKYTLSGFTYLPPQHENAPVTEYECYVSTDGENWKAPVSAGEFSNIQNSPILQEKRFKPQSGRFIRFRVKKVAENAAVAGIAEIGVITR